ncbi:Thymidylate kinase [Diplonema papillatum]|nr:Thymidylate kinase [Diplonema papillatum]
MTVYVQGLTAAERALCEKQRPGRVVAAEDGASFVGAWKEKAGDLSATDDDEDLLIVGSGAPACLKSAMYALFRRQIPVLSLEMTADDIEPSELLVASTGKTRSEAIEDFLSPAVTPGRIFTIEGGDGAGKQTQAAMLVDRLRSDGYPVRTIDFPHDSAMHGKRIREILSGKHGSISDVSPLFFSTLYSFNRDDVRPTLKFWLSRGYNVVLDRYMESSYGHQGAKLESSEEREKLIRRLQEFETRWLGIPGSYRVCYLDVAPKTALAALETDTTRKALDIHETAKGQYKEQVRACFKWCCEHFDHWALMPQEQGSGGRKTRDEAHAALWAALEPHFVNKAGSS